MSQDKQYTVEPATPESFPQDARAVSVAFHEDYMRVALLDGRYLYVPLTWFPAILRATPEQRAQVKLNFNGKMLSWHPDDTDGAINDDLLLTRLMRAE